MAIEAPDGTMYFANESGMLEFDGSRWNTYFIDGFGPIYSLVFSEDSKKIYVGSRDEFGYFERDHLYKWQYHSLRKLVEEVDGIEDCYQILVTNEGVYFDTYGKHLFRWDGQKIYPIRSERTWLVPFEGKVLAGVYNVGLGLVQNDSVILKNTTFKWEKDTGYEIFRATDGTPILFTGNHGLYIIDLETLETKPWDTEANKYFKNNSLYDILPWHDSLWACSTLDNGFIICNTSGELIDSLNKETGHIQNNYILSVTADSRQNLWLSTSTGLVYAKWNPNKSNIHFKPKSRISSIQIGDSSFVPNEPELYLETEISSLAVTFFYATPGYISEELEYSYWLEGFEDDWSVWTSDTKKEYTNLPSGDYKFFIKARTKDRILSEAAQFRIYIPTPWFKSAGFYIVSVLATIGLVITFIRVRTTRLKAQNRRLERLVNKRTAELVDQKEQLALANNELLIINHELDNFVYRSSHDLVAPLKSIKGLIQVAKMDSPSENQVEYLDMMNRSVAKLEEFIKSIMDYSINSKRPLEIVDVKIGPIICEIMEDVQYYNNVDKVKIIQEFDPELCLRSDPKRLKIIFSNLIINSIKYHNYNQPNPFVKICTQTKEGTIRFEIVDNGIGIDEQHQERIFEMFYRASDSGEGSGLGLYIVKDTVEMIGGKISLSSTVGRGTTFIVELSTRQLEQPIENH